MYLERFGDLVLIIVGKNFQWYLVKDEYIKVEGPLPIYSSIQYFFRLFVVQR